MGRWPSEDYRCLVRQGAGRAVVNGSGETEGLIHCWSHGLHWQEVHAKLIIDLFSLLFEVILIVLRVYL